MKHTLIAILTIAAAGCATVHAPPAAAPDGNSVATLAGEYDNHAQVWQAREDKTVPMPPHVHHTIVAVPKSDTSWDWTVRMDRPQQSPLETVWRYVLRTLEDGRRMLTPQRALPASDGDAAYASLAPCALVGRDDDGTLDLAADVAACSAILPGLGAQGALLPLRVHFDGRHLDVATFADQPRGEQAVEHAVRVRWFDGWVAINGAGPEARAESRDWHLTRDLRLHDQGGEVSIPWRDGSPSGYALRLEQIDYRQRGTRVLKLSLLRDDGGTIAYAWADPSATRIGLNLGWVQVGLDAGDAATSP